MKRVLIVTPGYYPAKTYGGPVVSIKNLTDALGDEIEFYILTSNHELKQKEAMPGLPNGFVQKGKAKVRYISDEEMESKVYERILDEIEPDCVYINAIYHSLLSPPMIKLARKKGIRCAIAVRGGLNPNAINISKYKKLSYLKYMKFILGENVCFHSTAREETKAIKRYFGESNEIVEVSNYPRCIDGDTEQYRVRKKENQIRIIYFSRIHPIKNLDFAIEVIGNTKVDCFFDIYGPIEDQDYWTHCLDLIKNLPPNVNAQYCGYLSNAELGQKLGKYDLFILPTSSENFGHAIAEALSEKCNVLISNNTPWNDINGYDFGRAIPLENKPNYTKFISDIAALTESEIQKQRNQIPVYLDEHFNLAEMKNSYERLFAL